MCSPDSSALLEKRGWATCPPGPEPQGDPIHHVSTLMQQGVAAFVMLGSRGARRSPELCLLDVPELGARRGRQAGLSSGPNARAESLVGGGVGVEPAEAPQPGHVPPVQPSAASPSLSTFSCE